MSSDTPTSAFSAADVIAGELSIAPRKVRAALELMADGATIPFISRYRKEVTGGLDEVALFRISTRSAELEELAKRKTYILSTIEGLGALTDELRARIEGTLDPAALEDIYLPYKPRRRTRAQVARENGLEPLAKIIMAQNAGNLERLAERYTGEKVPSAEDALKGASDIIAEWVNENETVRSRVRENFRRHAVITSRVVKGKETEGANYATYFDYSAPLSRCGSHNYLAMRRGEAEGFLKVGIDVDTERTLGRIMPLFLRRNASEECARVVEGAVTDAYRRLTRPAIETESASEAKVRADEAAIATFADNLRQLLLGSPLGSRRVLAIDPGFRTGCKTVCLDEGGALLCHDVIYPTPPANDTAGASRTILSLVKRHRIEAIAIGNGTASRETERFVRSLEFPHKVEIYVVSENGASVYSASEVARAEFPDQDVTVRGAVSIGRRLMDPLAELVKIDPKAIGVGQYQHDVDQAKLKASLDMTVESCVNSVGVDVNTASPQLLSYISGIGPVLASNIVAYRTANGPFPTREAIRKVPRLGPKAFEQCAGFLRIPAGEEILDRTAVHPERYSLVRRIARDNGMTVEQLVADPARLKAIDLQKYTDASTGMSTLTDIIRELEKPGRDPRQKAREFSFDETVRDISDLRPGMELPGIVDNVTDFGAFVDLGIHKRGLIHISQIADRRVSHPSEAVKLHQQLMVKVIDVDTERGRIALTLRGVQQP